MRDKIRDTKNNIINDDIIRIGSVNIITKYPIKKVENLQNKYVILLDIPSRIELGCEELNNVLCYNERGEFCWRISDKLPAEIIRKEQMPYVAIQIENEELYATDFWERKFKVDMKNGNLINVKIMH